MGETFQLDPRSTALVRVARFAGDVLHGPSSCNLPTIPGSEEFVCQKKN